MEETVKTLVLELQDIVNKQTNKKYSEVDDALTSLVEYVQEMTASKPGIESRLKELEDILYKRNEKKKPCKDHIRKIRNAMLVKPVKASASRSKQGKGNSTSPTPSVKSTPSQSQVNRTKFRNKTSPLYTTLGTKSNPASPAPGGKVNPLQGQIIDVQPFKNESLPKTTTLEAKRSEWTRTDETKELSGTIDQNEEEYQGEITDEVRFFEECLNGLKKMFSDDTKNPLEKIIPKPKGKTKMKVKTGHKDIMDVAGDIRRLQAENLYLRTAMDGIYKKVIGGDETTLNELKTSKNMKGNQLLLEVEGNIKEVTQKFHEIETELDYSYKRISQFLSTTVGNEGNEEQTQSDERLKNVKDTGRKARDNHVSTKEPSEQSLKLNKELDRVSSAWAKMKDKERELDYLYKRIFQFFSTPFEYEGSEGQTQSDERFKNNKDTGYKPKYNPVSTKEPSEQSLKLDTYLERVSSALARMREKESASTKLKEECDCLFSILDSLHKEIQYLTVGKTHTDEPSLLDQLSSSIAKESAAYISIGKAKEILNMQMECKRDKENNLRGAKILQSILDDLHEEVQALSKGEARNDSAFLFHQLENSVTNDSSFYQSLTKARAISSIQIEWKREAEYVACLLEELGQFSLVSKKGDNRNILSDPSKAISWAVMEKEDKNVQRNFRDKPSQLVHNQKLMKHYGNASHVLNQMKEKEDLVVAFQSKTAEMEDLKKRLQSIQVENTKLANNADSLRTRLSEHAGAALTHDNPSIADLSDPNRPTKLGEMYSELYDNQWTDAFGNLSKKYPRDSEEKVISYLYDILVDGHTFCHVVRQKQIWGLEDILFYPAGDMKSSLRRQKEEINKILAKNLSDAAKLSSNVASANMLKAFIMDEKIKSKYKEILQTCETYIEGCIQLFWLMQVQTPPVSLDFKTVKGQAFQNNYREYTKKGKKIAFVVWPALFLHENGPLLVKGVAQGQ